MTRLSELRHALSDSRAFTLRLVADLDDAALSLQSDPLFSPIGWHLGHVVWQEEVWALRRAGRQAPLSPEFDHVFDSFESAKPLRAELLPKRHVLLDYAERVREKTLALLERADLDADAELLREGYVFRFLANHERQHAEIIGIVRLLGALYLPAGPEQGAEERSASEYIAIPGGEFTLGSDDDPDGWDNERRAHRVTLDDFLIQRHPVSAGAWLEFMRASGYRDDRLWTKPGIIWRTAARVEAPGFWSRTGDGWQRRTLAGLVPIDPRRPVSHISHHEAVAFAAFAGARLPTEAEWERAAAWDGLRKRRYAWGDRADAAPPANLALSALDVLPRGSHAAGAAACGAENMIGGVWEWCDSLFSAYPGFVPQPYSNYSQPWFDGRHRVARGGSFLTQPEIARCCFRNWYEPHLRQPPLGLRLAR
jgi:iron(II)-dependent oxidoreductase